MTHSGLKLMRGIACPCVVARMHPRRTKRGNRARRRHHVGWRTIGGGVSHEKNIKKQVIGEDADLEKSGKMLNRVIEVVTASRLRRIRGTSGRY